MVSVSTAIKERHSTRSFINRPVDQELILDILDTARWAPSGGNIQPWEVIVVTGKAKEAVSKLATNVLAKHPKGEKDDYPIYPPDMTEVYQRRRYKVAEDMYATIDIPRENKVARMQWVLRNFEFFDASVGLFFVIDKSMGHGQWAHLGMFMQSVALIAQEKGLATCMQEAWGMLRGSLANHFELPEQKLIYAGLALGYADADAPVNRLRTERAAVSDFASLYGFNP